MPAFAWPRFHLPLNRHCQGLKILTPAKFTDSDFTGTSGIRHTLNDASSDGENPDVLDEFIAAIAA